MLTKSEVGKYRLKFMPSALEEWKVLDGGVKGPLRKALKKRLEQPHVPGSRLTADLTDSERFHHSGMRGKVSTRHRTLGGGTTMKKPYKWKVQ